SGYQHPSCGCRRLQVDSTFLVPSAPFSRQDPLAEVQGGTGPMLVFEFSLIALTLFCLIVGGLGILWCRASSCPHRTCLGRMLFGGTLLLIGAGLQLAAFYEAEGLIPLGLLAGFLVVAMLWEAPASKVVTPHI